MTMKNAAVDFNYDAWAEDQAKDKERESTLLWKAEQMFRLVPPGVSFETALEIGCAEGIVINRLRELLHIKKCYGIDISSKFLTVAKARFSDIEFIQVSGMKLPFLDKSIDLIILSDIIEHIDALDAFMKEIRRVGKRVILKVPLDKYLWRKLISEPLGRSPRVGLKHPDGHLHEFSGRSIKTMLISAGFRILASKVVYLYGEEEYKKRKGILKIRWFLDIELKKLLPNFAYVLFGGDFVTFLE